MKQAAARRGRGRRPPPPACWIICRPTRYSSFASRKVARAGRTIRIAGPARPPLSDFLAGVSGRNGAARDDFHKRERMGELFSETPGTPAPETGSVGAGTDSDLPSALAFQGLEVFRPIGDHPPEAHIAEAQRKEFFAQLHRWARQGHGVYVFCNNDGERQRFAEVWREYGLGPTESTANALRRPGPRLSLRGGQTGRGDRRGDFRALQGAASAPPQIAARPDQPVVAGHQFFRVGGGRLRRAFAAWHRTLPGPASHAFAAGRSPTAAACPGLRRRMPGDRISPARRGRSARPNFTCRSARRIW